MIKKFEEFINESKFNKYNTLEIRKKFRYDSSLSKYMSEEKGPYVLMIEHGYAGRDVDIDKEIKFPHFEDKMNKMSVEKIQYNIDTINSMVERDGKTLLTKEDLEDDGINRYIGLDDNTVIIYPFVDYDEMFEFVQNLDKNEDVDVFNFEMFPTQHRNNPFVYQSRGNKELAKELLDRILRLFDEKMGK